MSSYGLDSSHTGLGPAKGTCSLTCVVSRDLVSRCGPGEVVRWRWRRYLFILRQSRSKFAVVGSAVGKDAAVPKRVYSHSLSLPHKPTPPARAAIHAPKSVHWHSLSLFSVYPSHQRHDLAERTANPTFTCTPRLTFFARGVELREGRGESGVLQRVRRRLLAVLASAQRGSRCYAEVGHGLEFCAPKEPISFRLKQPGVCL